MQQPVNRNTLNTQYSLIASNCWMTNIQKTYQNNRVHIMRNSFAKKNEKPSQLVHHQYLSWPIFPEWPVFLIWLCNTYTQSWHVLSNICKRTPPSHVPDISWLLVLPTLVQKPIEISHSVYFSVSPSLSLSFSFSFLLSLSLSESE